MIHLFRVFQFLIVLILFSFSLAIPQAENVPVFHPVYDFLKRMEVKGIIERYHDAVLPLSRGQIAQYLVSLKEREQELTKVERNILADLFVEFQYDIHGSLDRYHSLIDSPEPTVGRTVGEFFSEKEKFLYAYTDTNVSFFVNGLLIWDGRRSTGDALGKANAAFVQFGGRIRGSILRNLGYYLQGTNAQFWGSRDVLRRDKFISQSFGLNTAGIQNFDFVEGYAQYNNETLSLQVGRERLLWGNGYGGKMIVSDNVRVFDFIRAEVQYKSLKYTFVHAWLLGRPSRVMFTLPSDTTFQFTEPINADKYFAAHRLEFSLASFLDVGFQEMAVYSNRSPDLAYLNPITLIESAQRSREERDNVLWSFDIQLRLLRQLELHGAILFDDINFPQWGTNSVQNKNAFQVGLLTVDPLGISNIAAAVEYTLIEPYTFSHNRSRDNNYSSGGSILGHHIGPNSDCWFFRFDYLLTHRLSTSIRFEIQREGNNIYDSTGTLVKNVGGDFLQPHRVGKDSDRKEFLGGNLVETHRLQAFATYEIVNEIFLDLRYEMTRRKMGTTMLDHDFGAALRIDF
jgi:hypothetical protein